jgi:hypothetical protein
MNILDHADRLGLDLKRKASTDGGEYAGACPKCFGTDRFLVWPNAATHMDKGGRFWCRQCNYHGDGIQLIRDLIGLGYQESCAMLGIEAGVFAGGHRWHPPVLPETAKWGPRPLEFLDPSFICLADDLVWSCHKWTVENGSGSLGQRGLTSYSIEQFRLGYNSVDQKLSPCHLGIPRDDYPSDKEWTGKTVWFPAGDVIPILVDNRVVSVKVRRKNYGKPGDRGPKYHILKGSKMITGVYHFYPEGLPVIVVESELDAILLWQEAREFVCPISLGSAGNKPDERANALIANAPSVLIALDNDAAGHEAWPWWRSQHPDAFRVVPPGCKSPGDFFQQGGGLREWVRLCLIQSGYYVPPRSQEHTISTYNIRPMDASGEANVERIERKLSREYSAILDMPGSRPLRNLVQYPKAGNSENNPLVVVTTQSITLPLEGMVATLPDDMRNLARAKFKLDAIREKKKRSTGLRRTG